MGMPPGAVVRGLLCKTIFVMYVIPYLIFFSMSFLLAALVTWFSVWLSARLVGSFDVGIGRSLLTSLFSSIIILSLAYLMMLPKLVGLDFTESLYAEALGATWDMAPVAGWAAGAVIMLIVVKFIADQPFLKTLAIWLGGLITQFIVLVMVELTLTYDMMETVIS